MREKLKSKNEDTVMDLKTGKLDMNEAEVKYNYYLGTDKAELKIIKD